MLGGEVRELTLMFCDVRNFTTISEGLTASELTTFINELLTPLSDIILRERGTIDKYMGDAIMAFWNAPLDVGGHPQRACRCAIEMIGKMADLNEMWTGAGAAPPAGPSTTSGSESGSTPAIAASAISAASSASTIRRSATRSM